MTNSDEFIIFQLKEKEKSRNHALQEDILEIIDDVLFGIDICEPGNDLAWWETSGGEEFGAERKKELKEKILSRLRAKCNCPGCKELEEEGL